jgi:anti-sigma factor RsiW
MAMIEQADREREDIEMLLPWYENGTLAPDEMRRVEAYLARHPEMRSQIGLIREEMAETVAANESLGMPGSAARDRLMAQIAAEPGASPVHVRVQSWLARLVPQGWSPAWAIAGAVACLIILVQAAALISLQTGARHEGGAELAAGDRQAAAAGTFVLIRFAEDAPAREVAALLQSVSGVVVDGPKPGGAYKVRISPRALSTGDRDAVIAKLRARTDVVAFVAPTR